MTDEQASAGTQQKQAGGPPAGRRRARRWLIALLLVVAVVVAALTSLPYGLSYGLKQWFTSIGARSVEVEDIDFNPFTGRLHVDNLRVTGKSGGTMRVKAAQFEFSWLPLWKKRFLLEAIAVEDGELQVLREPEGGWEVGVIALATAEPEVPAEPTEWQIGLRRIDVANLTVILSLPEFSNKFHINSASIQRAVAWEPDVPATIEAVYTVDGAPVQLDAEVFPFREELEAKGRLKLEGVGLERYVGLLQPTLTRLSGTASADLSFKVLVGDAVEVSNEGSLSVADIVVAGDNFETSQERLAWKGRVDLHSGGKGQQIDGEGDLEIDGVKVAFPVQSIDQGRLQYAGTFSVAMAGAGTMPAVTVEGDLSASQLAIKLAERATELAQGELSWSGGVNLAGEEAGLRVEGDGTLELTNTELRLPDQQVRGERLKWSGDLVLLLAEDPAASTAAVDGGLESGKLSLKAGDALELEQADVAWQGSIDLTGMGDAVELASDGTLQAGQTRLESPDIDLQNEDVAWEGKVDFRQKPGAAVAVSASGKLGGGGLDARLKQQQLHLAYGGLDWSGRLGSGKGKQASASGSLKVKGIKLDTERGLVLVSADDVRVNEVSMPGASAIDVADVQVTNLAAGVPADDAEAGRLARAGGVKLSGIQWRAGERAAVEAVDLEGLDVQLVRTGEGGWRTIDEMRAATGGTAAASPPATGETQEPEDSPPADKPAFAIGHFAITGDSRLRFEDQAVKPAAVFDVALQEAQISALDTSKPAQESPLKLTGKLGEAARLSAEGHIKPFADPFAADLKGKITNLHVSDISPYAADAIGYELTGGRFTAVMDFKAEGGKLDGNNKLTFNELEVKAVPDAETKLSVPLETGLAMLRDREGRIRLEVPVSGDVDNPEFSAADAINQALVKATEKAAVGYLALTLQPWGAILLAADIAKDLGAGATAKLDAITFAPGSSALKPEFDDYLEKVATLLDERPDVQLRLCGRAVKQDLAVPVKPPPRESKWKKLFEKKKDDEAAPATRGEDELVHLARDRGAAVLDILIEEHGVGEERIYTCDPKPDPSDEGEPRVDVAI